MNLYAHFPFCRRKCAYCALYSRAGTPQSQRDEYVRKLTDEIRRLPEGDRISTVYFGGGSPALCDLKPIFSALQSRLFAPASAPEFTVELHPLDVKTDLLETLREGGVNRISMGVQSFDDATLEAMGRGYTVDEALGAFELVKKYFDNAGIDLIIGFPGDVELGQDEYLKRFAELGMRHCSVYSLQNERGLKNVPDDEVVLDRLKSRAQVLAGLGLERYEISNYALPGFECRHNLAVWRGEDYLGLGEGACGRIGLKRTRGIRSACGPRYESETLSPGADLKERTIFRLRTREGLDASGFPSWRPILDRFVDEGLLTSPSYPIYRLTPRGTEVCDTILAELV